MARRLAAYVTLLAVLPVGSAPRLRDEPPRVYFPMTVGDRWVVEQQLQSGSEEYTEVVTEVEKKDGATIVTVGREVDGKAGPALSHVRVTDDGVYRMSLLGTKYDPPYCVLRLPLKPGLTWKSEVQSGGVVRTTFQYKAVGEEDVEVPAGKFRAFRLDVNVDSNGRQRTSSIWYAPNVGVVKLDHRDADGGYVRVLKSFRPGKK